MQGFTRDQTASQTALNIYPAIKQARDIATIGVAHEIRVVEKFDPSLPEVTGNHDALVQVLLNLIANAAQAMDGAPGTITLSTTFRHGVGWDLGDGAGSQKPSG
ncbi:MAG: hypothetical protein HC853_10480 [Anaerolineae bacterium]|nr:hypothetical protein [Anaerolineae bacterium]